MKKNKGKYEVINNLPANALSVKEFAAKSDTSTQNIYLKVSRKTNEKEGWKIVTFQDINFIIKT